MITRWDRNQWLTTTLEEQLDTVLHSKDGPNERFSKVRLVHFDCRRGADQRHSLVHTGDKTYCSLQLGIWPNTSQVSEPLQTLAAPNSISTSWNCPKHYLTFCTGVNGFIKMCWGNNVMKSMVMLYVPCGFLCDSGCITLGPHIGLLQDKKAGTSVN